MREHPSNVQSARNCGGETCKKVVHSATVDAYQNDLVNPEALGGCEQFLKIATVLIFVNRYKFMIIFLR